MDRHNGCIEHRDPDPAAKAAAAAVAQPRIVAQVVVDSRAVLSVLWGGEIRTACFHNCALNNKCGRFRSPEIIRKVTWFMLLCI